MSKQTVKITLQIPKGVIDFVSDLFKFSGETQPIEEFLAEELLGDIKSIAGDLPRTWFDPEKLAKKYGLDKS